MILSHSQLEEIAAAVIFAASEEAGFMNGVNIPVDGAGSL